MKDQKTMDVYKVRSNFELTMYLDLARTYNGLLGMQISIERTE